MTRIHTMTGAELPPLVYAHNSGHDLTLTQPRHFRPIRDTGYVKPDGGLWTAPVTARNPDGSVASTAWLDWCRDNDFEGDYTRMAAITPDPRARVVVVDSLEDLRALVSAYPAPVSRLGMSYPSWSAAADAGWDAVYLTDDGQWATRLTHPDLYGWDCASVLWLRPAYHVGDTYPVRAEVTE